MEKNKGDNIMKLLSDADNLHEKNERHDLKIIK